MLIGLLCNKDLNEPTYRISFLGLIKASQTLGFECKYVEELTSYPDVIFSSRHIDPTFPQVNNFLNDCKQNGTKIVVFVNDVYQEDYFRLNNWEKISDLILCPTKYHKDFIQSLVDIPVKVMIDSIDYNLDSFLTPQIKNPIPKICWFGYPESYYKSMAWYEPIIQEIVNKGLIEFYLITSPSLPSKFPVIPFDNATFVENLKQFDGCILSHAPLDYNINTFVKSPNKLILSITLGVPCIVSNTPSYSEILTNTNLQNYKFSGVESFKKSLNLLLSSENRLEYLKNSQQYVLDNFSYMQMGEQFLQALK